MMAAFATAHVRNKRLVLFRLMGIERQCDREALVPPLFGLDHAKCRPSSWSNVAAYGLGQQGGWLAEDSALGGK